ncbi:capsular biosynthesis protein [Phenylobacterium sp.]|uniref:capsular biosynthesis protein n=1 Tax=Phenylobacterium sp. TaxID=1871053 RepID=UPI003BAAEFB1
MKRLVFDLDGTIALDDPSRTYAEREPNLPVIARLREYREQGFSIIIASARNMRTYGGQIGLINANTLPVILDWLARHQVPYDEVHVGKPWCGTEGFYIDDRAVRPSEFLTLSLDEIAALIAAEA